MAFTKLVLLGRAGLLEALCMEISVSEISNPEDFHDLMKASFKHGGLSSRKFADDTGFSFSSVNRWISGRSKPHPSLWPTIIKQIDTALKEKIRDYRSAASLLAI